MMLQLMFEHASSFLMCAKLCAEETESQKVRFDLLGTPEIVNLAFACEVYIKTLLKFYRIKVKKEHKLNELLAWLPDDVQYEIKQQTFQKHPVYNYSTGKILTNGFGLDLLDLEANDFVDWRYLYEFKRCSYSCDVGFLRAFAVTLRDVCCERLFRMSWKEYCKANKLYLDL